MVDPAIKKMIALSTIPISSVDVHNSFETHIIYSLTLNPGMLNQSGKKSGLLFLVYGLSVHDDNVNACPDRCSLDNFGFHKLAGDRISGFVNFKIGLMT